MVTVISCQSPNCYSIATFKSSSDGRSVPLQDGADRPSAHQANDSAPKNPYIPPLFENRDGGVNYSLKLLPL